VLYFYVLRNYVRLCVRLLNNIINARYQITVSYENLF